MLNLFDGDTFVLDNSRYEHIMRCMRSAEYGIVHAKVGGEAKQALKFGSAGHLCHKFRYKYYGNKPITEEGQVRQFILLEQFFEANPCPIGDYRSLGFAQYVIEEYNNFYQHENFEILKLPNGTPVVEEGFAIPLGEVGNKKVVWKGRIDLGIEDEGGIWAEDHKHVSQGGDYALQEYFTSNQLKGYTWALKRLLGTKVMGGMINMLVCRKQTKTGKNLEFVRAKFDYPDDVLDEWVFNTLTLVGDFLHSHERNYFPMQTTQCVGRYGVCQYRQVCTMAPATRMQWLHTGEYRDDVFDPLHEDEVDLEKIKNMPIPANYKRIQPVDPSKQVADEMTSLMKDLLG